MSELRRWFGLRCAVSMCPCAPTHDGWMCTICGKRERWDGLEQNENETRKNNPGGNRATEERLSD